MNHIDLEACRRAIELLPWYANDSLRGEERLQVAAHLDDCASCRREVEILAAVIANIPAPRSANSDAAPFSRLLQKINRHERRLRAWKIAALVLIALSAIMAVVLPTYVLEPRYRAVTDVLPETAGIARFQVTVDPENDIAALTDVLERYNADIVAGPGTDGSFLLEFRLAPGESAAELRRRLDAEARIRTAEWQGKQGE